MIKVRHLVWLGLALMASHAMDASAQATTPHAITLSTGRTVNTSFDENTNLEWYAFESYKDGLELGFRMATVDDLKAYNKMSTSPSRLINGMQEISVVSPVNNRAFMDRINQAYVMDGETLSILTITETYLYWCDRQKLSAAECVDKPSIRAFVYAPLDGALSLDTPGTYSGNVANVGAVITAAMVREAAPVPEPASAGLALVGLMLAGGMARRRHASH